MLAGPEKALPNWRSIVKESWVTSANNPRSDFPIQNLPYGVFRHRERNRIGVAIGDQILNLHACAESGLLSVLPEEIVESCRMDRLNLLMSLGSNAWSTLRREVMSLLDAGASERRRVEPHLISMREVAMQLPAQIGDYTDFYASIDHATRVGRLFRPEQPLLQNYKRRSHWLPRARLFDCYQWREHSSSVWTDQISRGELPNIRADDGSRL